MWMYYVENVDVLDNPSQASGVRKLDCNLISLFQIL